jgi:hypothetical protein
MTTTSSICVIHVKHFVFSGVLLKGYFPMLPPPLSPDAAKHLNSREDLKQQACAMQEVTF